MQMVIASRNIDDFLLPEIRELTRPLSAIPIHQFLFNAGNVEPRAYIPNRVCAFIAAATKGICFRFTRRSMDDKTRSGAVYLRQYDVRIKFNNICS